LLDPIEETLAPVAGTIEIRAEADWIAAIAFFGGMLAHAASPGLGASLNHRHPTKLNAPDQASAPAPRSGKSGDQPADNPR